MTKVLLLLFFSLNLLANSVKAQDIQVHRLPEGRRVTAQGETYQCFNLGEYKDLLHMDNDLEYLSTTKVHQEQISGELRKQVGLLEQRVLLAESEVSKSKVRLDEKNVLLEDTVVKLNTQLDKATKVRNTTFVVSAVIVSILGGVIVGVTVL